ncbi:MAG: YgaP family membrane protein [Candidatus Baltobacteraceae bacterium]
MVDFLFSGTAHIIRAVVGILLMFWAYQSLHGIGRDIVGIIGLVFLLSGLINFCGLSPLFGGPFMKRAAK